MLFILILLIFVHSRSPFRPSCLGRILFLPLRFLQLSLLLRVLDLRNEHFEAVFPGQILLCTGNALKDSNLCSPNLFRLLKARRLEYERDILGTWIGEDVAERCEAEITPERTGTMRTW